MSEWKRRLSDVVCLAVAIAALGVAAAAAVFAYNQFEAPPLVKER